MVISANVAIKAIFDKAANIPIRYLKKRNPAIY
jgi:hypothetical protein